MSISICTNFDETLRKYYEEMNGLSKNENELTKKTDQPAVLFINALSEGAK